LSSGDQFEVCLRLEKELRDRELSARILFRFENLNIDVV
jgi:hypothetical protein